MAVPAPGGPADPPGPGPLLRQVVLSGPEAARLQGRLRDLAFKRDELLDRCAGRAGWPGRAGHRQDEWAGPGGEPQAMGWKAMP